jgi:heptosyltransferase I
MKSICILRLSAIGDVTHVLPVIATLQQAFPAVKITWVIGKLEHKLMQNLSGVEFIVFDKSLGSKAYKIFNSKIKGRKFDALLQMQYSFRANRAAWKIKAKQRIGFDKKRSREFHSYKLTHRINAVEKQHVLDGFMEFAKVLGVKKCIYQWNITTAKEDENFALQFIDKTRINVVISPCSSNPLRNWSVGNYAIIVDYIAKKYKANIIICGSPSAYEIEFANKISQQSQAKVINIAGQDTLKQLYALMQQADLVLSPDSGPMHIANAAQTPVIGLHAATTAKRSGAYNYLDLAVDKFEEAAVKFLHKPADKIRWGGQVIKAGAMDLITVADVKEKIDLVLHQS